MTMLGHKAVTIKDIAREVGVTKMTVSRALSGQGRISAPMRRHIQHTAQRMGYQPNALAQSLSRGQSKLIGLFSVAMFPGVHTRTVETIQDSLARRGYDVPLYGFGHRARGDAKYQHEILASLLSQRPRAIICHLSSHLQHPAIIETLLQYQRKGGVLVCYGDIAEMPFDYVSIDYQDLVYRSARHLIELGHRRIGLHLWGLNDPEETRSHGFRRALWEAGLEVREDWLFDTNDMENGGARLAEIFLNLPERPSAMVVVSDLAAGPFINGLLRAGVRVPEEVSVIGQHDEPLARHWLPPLTTAALPVEAMAQRVIELLDDRLNGDYDGPPRQVVVQSELIVRDSTAAYAGD